MTGLMKRGEKKDNRWGFWLYSAILVALAVGGVVLCLSLKKQDEQPLVVGYYEAEDTGNIVDFEGDGNVPLADPAE